MNRISQLFAVFQIVVLFGSIALYVLTCVRRQNMQSRRVVLIMIQNIKAQTEKHKQNSTWWTKWILYKKLFEIILASFNKTPQVRSKPMSQKKHIKWWTSCLLQNWKVNLVLIMMCQKFMIIHHCIDCNHDKLSAKQYKW